MFWKIFEFVVRLVYFRRFRQADRIAIAAEIAGRGETDEALAELDKLETNLHQSIKPVYGLTRGRILSAEGRLAEAEKVLIFAAQADPSNVEVHLDLAVVAGRRFRFEDARERLEKLVADADEDTGKKAGEILELLTKVLSGEREAEFERRARAMAEKPIGTKGETAGLPADMTLLESWIASNPEEARELADEIALLIGQSAVTGQGAGWKVNLAIEDSRVVLPNGTERTPFQIVAKRLSSDSTSLVSLVDIGSK
ncbi:MAG: tetratricopeptide repeat protein [Deltaproteobacteria bacterium]|nr:tetratricopeptide repeat protein [Deltaproteobacteria bacterium]